MKSFYPKIAIVFLFIFSLSTAAQENCQNITHTSEVLLNLQLGMSADEINKRFRDLKIKVKNDKDHRFFQNYIDKKAPPGLNGVRAIYLRFFAKKLYQIEIFWQENKYPAEIKEFAEIISTQMNLPASDWNFAHRQATLKCGETTLKADFQLNPRIELTDEVILEKVTELQKTKKN